MNQKQLIEYKDNRIKALIAGNRKLLRMCQKQKELIKNMNSECKLCFHRRNNKRQKILIPKLRIDIKMLEAELIEAQDLVTEYEEKLHKNKIDF